MDRCKRCDPGCHHLQRAIIIALIASHEKSNTCQWRRAWQSGHPIDRQTSSVPSSASGHRPLANPWHWPRLRGVQKTETATSRWCVHRATPSLATTSLEWLSLAPGAIFHRRQWRVRSEGIGTVPSGRSDRRTFLAATTAGVDADDVWCRVVFRPTRYDGRKSYQRRRKRISQMLKSKIGSRGSVDLAGIGRCLKPHHVAGAAIFQFALSPGGM